MKKFCKRLDSRLRGNDVCEFGNDVIGYGNNVVMRWLILFLLFIPFVATSQHMPAEQALRFVYQRKIHQATAIPTSLSLFPGADPAQVVWSILIPTITRRRNMFDQLFMELLRQIETAGLQHKVEIVFFRDKCRLDIGFKRNKLIEAAKGTYISFVDDDDKVAPHYIAMIYQKLRTLPDCVELKGILYRRKQAPKLFIHSLKYQAYSEDETAFYRPPNHLNPIKRSIALQVKFPDKKNFGEDTDWAMKLAKSGLLKTESLVAEPYYFYYFNGGSVSTRKAILARGRRT